MPKDRRTRKSRGNNNGFKPYEPYKSHARGNTRNNRKMAHRNNFPAWHSQMDEILAKAQRNSEMLGAIGRAGNAFGTQGQSTLPPPANRAARKNATYKRLLSEYMDLKEKSKRTAANNTRMRNLEVALEEYAPVLNL